MSERCGVKSRNAFAIWSREGQMKTGTRRTVAFMGMFYRQLVATAGNPIAHGLIVLAGPEVIPDTHISNGRQNGVIEGG